LFRPPHRNWSRLPAGRGGSLLLLGQLSIGVDLFGELGGLVFDHVVQHGADDDVRVGFAFGYPDSTEGSQSVRAQAGAATGAWVPAGRPMVELRQWLLSKMSRTVLVTVSAACLTRRGSV